MWDGLGGQGRWGLDQGFCQEAGWPAEEVGSPSCLERLQA